MNTAAEPGEESLQLADSISNMARAGQHTVASAESLTGGGIAAVFASAEGSSEWFKGGVVAYSTDVKVRVLNVTPGPVICASCAEEMAHGVARLMRADYSIATTGVGGPGEQEDQPTGTVFIGVHTPSGARVDEWHFEGGPEQIVQRSTLQALRMLEAEMRR